MTRPAQLVYIREERLKFNRGVGVKEWHSPTAALEQLQAQAAPICLPGLGVQVPSARHESVSDHHVRSASSAESPSTPSGPAHGRLWRACAGGANGGVPKEGCIGRPSCWTRTVRGESVNASTDFVDRCTPGSSDGRNSRIRASEGEEVSCPCMISKSPNDR